MSFLFNIFQLVLATCTFVVGYVHYAPGIMPAAAPDWLAPVLVDIVLFGVVGVSVVLALGHVVGGGFFGMVGGNILDGMRLGLVLGLGMAIGRLWPYILAWGGAGYFAKAPALHWVGAVVAAVICFGLYRVLIYFWSDKSSGGIG
jgi:hypothetical protein